MKNLSLRKRLLLFLFPAIFVALTACGESDRDETAPAIKLTTVVDAITPRQEATVDLAGEIEIGAALEVRLNDTLVSGFTVNGNAWQGTLSGLQAGSNLIELTAVDSAGNTNNINITIVRDNTAPTVTATAPAADAVDVPVDTKLNVTFSEALQKETIAPNFVLASPLVTSVDCAVDYTEGGLNAVITPAGSLTAGTTYTATFTAGITDLAGNPLTPFSFTFTTVGP